jgi:hypothetical protein
MTLCVRKPAQRSVTGRAFRAHSARTTRVSPHLAHAPEPIGSYRSAPTVAVMWQEERIHDGKRLMGDVRGIREVAGIPDDEPQRRGPGDPDDF